MNFLLFYIFREGGKNEIAEVGHHHGFQWPLIMSPARNPKNKRNEGTV